MDYSKHRPNLYTKSRKRPEKKSKKKCSSSLSLFSSTSSSSSSETSYKCKHVFKEEKCRGHQEGCIVRKCCKCQKIIVCCKCKTGATGPPGPTGAQGNNGHTGAAGLIGGVFGNGADGDVDLCLNPMSIPNPLDRDYYFNSLRVCGNLMTGGYRIFVRETLELVNDAIISDDGQDGGAFTGVGAPIGTYGPGTNGAYATKGVDAHLPTIGGQGGGGKFAGGKLFPFSLTSGGPDLLNAFPQNITGRDLNGITISGGTGGGGDDGLGPGGISPSGGGGGAGVIIITARKITGQGLITTIGGSGGTRGKTGGGGGGGIILNYAELDSNNITANVSGGLGYNGGVDGNHGSTYLVKV